MEAKRVELGVADELAELAELTPAMLVAFGENDIKTTEDLAGCASDDLLGYVETQNNERVRVPGAFDGFDVTADEANALIMNARVKAGWISAEDLLPPAEEEEEEDGETSETGEAGEGDGEAAAQGTE